MDDMLVLKDMVRSGEVGDAYEYVMSDASVDRYGDIVDPAGWDLKHFKKNPIALFGHSSGFPIGKWKDLRVEGGKLMGKLDLLAKGASQRVDEIRALIEAGILRAVSVGFRPLAAEPLNPKEPWGPQKYTKQELVECSVVSIPANPNALAVAKSLNVSDEVRTLIFGEHAAGDFRTRSEPPKLPGKSADTPKPIIPNGKKMSLADRIKAAEANVISLKDQLTDHVTKNEEMDDTAVAVSDELSDRIGVAEKTLAALKKAESHLGATSTVVKEAPASSAMEISGRVYPSLFEQKIKRPADLMIRSLVCLVQGKVQQRRAHDVMAERYGDDRETRTMMDFVTKTATAPATTTTSGWASQLVATTIGDFIDSLMPLSIFPNLQAKGGRFTFGRAGVVSLPSRLATPTIAGSFIAEGAPIPVRQGAFQAITITPRKMAVISTMTREIVEHSTPAIEEAIRTAILQDTAVALDTVLMDATAASTTRPAGLRNGAATQAGTAGANLAAVTTDVKYLLGVLIAANSLRSPVWIMNPIQALGLSLITNGNGEFPFKDEVAGGTFFGYPVILSTTQTAGTVMLIDAADFFSATGDEPNFDVNDTATLHMEDTTPLAIGTAGTPNVVAAPVRSLWQTDSIGIRMRMDVNWAMRRTGVVAYVTATTW